jgi:site-specific DNA-adenine methylase
MQPSPKELLNRVSALATKMRGVKGLSQDITSFDVESISGDAIVYVDPPYGGTTSYGFGFDLASFAETVRERSSAALFISEGRALSSNSVKLNFGGANGGISGKRVLKHEEWVSRF